MRNIARQFYERESEGNLDALICNAGELLNRLTFTSESIETTLACHLIYGAYLLTDLLLPALRRCHELGREPRVVFVSSGGMYTTKFPAWRDMVVEAPQVPAEYISENVSSDVKGAYISSQAGEKKGEKKAEASNLVYDGTLQYAYAKRGQVRRYHCKKIDNHI